MNHKTAWIIALITFQLVAAGSVLHAQTKDNGRDEQAEKEGQSRVHQD